MYKDLIGKKSEKVKSTIERGLVKKFAESIGDLHPIYEDEEAGKNSVYGTNIAPPTFPRVLSSGTIEGLKLPKKGLIHGEQNYHYERPLLVGEEIYSYSVIEDYYERRGSNGLMGFIAMKRYGEDAKGDVIFTEESITIITETVRKAMKV
jgi:acyl dehydratase